MDTHGGTSSFYVIPVLCLSNPIFLRDLKQLIIIEKIKVLGKEQLLILKELHSKIQSTFSWKEVLDHKLILIQI